jgi:predicted NAD/FAD-dependent oxidoreductase
VALASAPRSRRLLHSVPVQVGGVYRPHAPHALDEVAEELWPELQRLLAAAGGCGAAAAARPAWMRAQRWGRAFPEAPLGVSCLSAPHYALAAAGDWCPGFGAEGAWLSGSAAADAVADAVR